MDPATLYLLNVFKPPFRFSLIERIKDFWVSDKGEISLTFLYSFPQAPEE